MSGNRAIFDRAIEQSREAARQNRWDEALKNAVRALQEFPNDTNARTTAAVALFQTGKLDRALQLFEELRKTEPENTFFLGYVAQVYEQQGNTATAGQSYQAIADLHQRQNRPVKAIEALRALLRLQPNLAEQRSRLAGLLEGIHSTHEAATEYVILGQQRQQQGQLDDAAAHAEKALQLDASNGEATMLLDALRDEMAAVAKATPISDIDADAPVRSALSGMTGNLRSQQFTVEKLIAQAIEYQEAGDSAGAIEYYQRAVQGGMERADVFYSLGLLYQEQGDHTQAIPMLRRAASDPEYALSSHFAMGTSYQESNQLQQAAEEFERTIRLVDLDSIGRAESDDLIQMYENAASIYEQVGDVSRAALLYSTLASFLQTKRWGRERATEFNRRAREMTERDMFSKLRTLGTGALTPQDAASVAADEPLDDADEQMPETWGKIRPITDFLRSDYVSSDSGDALQPVVAEPAIDPLALLDTLPPAPMPTYTPVTTLDTAGLSDEAAHWVTLSNTYIEQGLIEAALDACHEVIRTDIEYLPIHLRMGEIYERQNRQEEALAKYQLLIDTYRVRGESELGIDVYFRFIDLSPDTINARSRLADLLRGAGRTDDAVVQSLQVAATYFRLGQTNKSLEEYRRLLQWSPQNKEVHAQYGLTLLKLERYEAALGEFRKALAVGEADDPVGIARLNMTLALMGEQPAAVWDSLATLLSQLKAQPQHYNSVQAEYRAALLAADAGILHYILAIVQQQANQHTSALLELEQAQSLLESDVDPLLHPVLVHQATADSYIALGQAEEALEQLRRGQAVAGRGEADPAIKHAFAVPLSKGDLVRRMAEAYAASDDMAGAEQALLEARKLLPYDRAVYTKLADVYFRQGKLSEALAQLDDLATHYEGRQLLDRAIETLAYALKLAPNHIDISSRLARMQLRRGYLDKGVAELVRVSELQRRAGQIKDAVASLQEAAQVHWMLSQHDKANQLYDRIVQIAPQDVEARQWLALMHTLAFRTTEAIAEKKQIVKIFTQQRDYENAIAELHQIIGLDQKDTDAYYMLGDMLMRREEYTQAAQLYNRMLKMEGVEVARVEALRVAASRMLKQQPT